MAHSKCTYEVKYRNNGIRIETGTVGDELAARSLPCLFSPLLLGRYDIVSIIS